MILLVSAIFPPEFGTSGRMANDIAQELAKYSDTIVIAPFPSRPSSKVFEINANTHSTNKFQLITIKSFSCPKSRLFGRMRESLSFGIKVAKYIELNKESINGIYIDAWPLIAEYLIVRKSRQCSIPSIISIDDLYPESIMRRLPIFKRQIYRILLPISNYCLSNSSKVIAISLNMVDTMLNTRLISRRKIVLLPRWQDESEFIHFHQSIIPNDTEGKLNSLFTFMFLGNIGPVAGVELFIEAFIENPIDGARLVIAGSGSNKSHCENLVKGRNDLQIEFWDAKDGKVPELQSQADVLLLPTIKGEGMNSIPSKLVAYMFSKKPILASIDLASDTSFAIIESKCGWIIPPGDKDLVNQAFKKISEMSKSSLVDYGENGFEYAIQNYSKKANLSKAVSMISAICK